MSTREQNPDAPESQVLFLNFDNPPMNAIPCPIRGDAVDLLLRMLGATPGFVSSLTLAEKKAIVFLASYAVDWRLCREEYNDIASCFGRGRRCNKCAVSGLSEPPCEIIEYAERIQATRIEPKIVWLRQTSYHLNRGIAAVMPTGNIMTRAATPPDGASSSRAVTDSDLDDTSPEATTPIHIYALFRVQFRDR
ncbi:hypothetical protein F4824DRAFT_504464 [Ustulina deusta]|nr:hypothetical protein F4824DRAFT_504464 [Ustulina deusta]